MADRLVCGKLADFYLAHPRLIGFIYGTLPVALWFALVLLAVPFRGVYLLRLVISLALAGGIGAWLNAYGLRFWLLKHNSKYGPATLLDGIAIGAAIGIGTALLPPLTALISSNHLEGAKWFIIASWLAAPAIGGLWGGIVTYIGAPHISRESCLEPKGPK